MCLARLGPKVTDAYQCNHVSEVVTQPDLEHACAVVSTSRPTAAGLQRGRDPTTASAPDPCAAEQVARSATAGAVSTAYGLRTSLMFAPVKATSARRVRPALSTAAMGRGELDSLVCRLAARRGLAPEDADDWPTAATDVARAAPRVQARGRRTVPYLVVLSFLILHSARFHCPCHRHPRLAVRLHTRDRSDQVRPGTR